mmetsp:Transcript_706/g.1026  ORF Transcript_706/g.1026 Transcript_706/m.1026 type:complete len:641 (+) Transcript_706:34-1956(+)
MVRANKNLPKSKLDKRKAFKTTAKDTRDDKNKRSDKDSKSSEKKVVKRKPLEDYSDLSDDSEEEPQLLESVFSKLENDETEDKTDNEDDVNISKSEKHSFPGFSGSEQSDEDNEGNVNDTSSDISPSEDDDWMEEDNDSPYGENMDILEASKALDKKNLKKKLQSEKEIKEGLERDIMEAKEDLVLPCMDPSNKTNKNFATPPEVIRERIAAIIEVLTEFNIRRNPDISRGDYLEQLARDIAEYYGCLRSLVDLFMALFPSAEECVEFLEASDRPRPVVIRTNTLKIRRKDLLEALKKRGVNAEAISKWSKVGIKIIQSSVPIGATPEYLAGHYMLQSAASMCPVMALDPQPEERVLDMSCAPGGKTSYICQLMKNTGCVIANDLKKERQTATVANLHRLGVRNAIVCCQDGRFLAPSPENTHKKKNKETYNGYGLFDRVLLDAPCSGLGVISHDPSVKIQRTIKDIRNCSFLQKELILSAIDCINLKSNFGGVLVYSTCSVAIEENEEVIEYALSKRNVKLIPCGLDHGLPGLMSNNKGKKFHPSMKLSRRFYPHVHNMDGFFVAKLKKVADGPKLTTEAAKSEMKKKNKDSESKKSKKIKESKGSKEKANKSDRTKTKDYAKSKKISSKKENGAKKNN